MSFPSNEATDVSHFQAILEAAVDGIIIITSQGIIERVNTATERIFGYRADEILGRNVSVLMSGPDQSRHDQYISNFLTTNASQIIGTGREVQGLKKDGNTFPMHLSIGEAKEGEEIRFVGLIRDLSERQQLVARLSVTEEEFRLVFDKASIGVLICTKNGEVSKANPWICEFLGYKQNEIIGRPIESFTLDSDKEKYKLGHSRLIKNQDPTLELEISFQTKYGDLRAVKLQANSLEQTTLSESLLFLISDRSAELARQLMVMEARDNLAHSDRLHSLGEMASAIAHEINQPLAAINAYAQASTRLLEQPVTTEEDITETLKKISLQAERGGEIIRRIRNFATKGQNNKSLEDLNELLYTATQFTQFSLDAAGVALNQQFSQDLPKVLIDRLQIQQVCINLIRNAVDAIMSSETGKKSMTIISELDGAAVNVRFADQGCGVPEDLRQRLFQPFQSGKEGGLGLGLAISYKIIVDHNGKLEYQPAEEGGSVFSFTLPIIET